MLNFACLAFKHKFVPSDNIVYNTVKLSAKNWLVNTAVSECNVISVATI